MAVESKCEKSYKEKKKIKKLRKKCDVKMGSKDTREAELHVGENLQ